MRRNQLLDVKVYVIKLDNLIEKQFSELERKAKTFPNNALFVDEEEFQLWATRVMSLFQRVLGKESDYYKNFLFQYKQNSNSISDFLKCRGIFQSAKKDYEAGYLFTVRGLIKAEDTIDILDQAEELLKSNYKDAACILAGVSLEITLKELCARNKVPFGKLDAMNMELCKIEVYNKGIQKQITAWAHWRNKAAHGEWDEYTASDVSDMLKGVLRFTSEYL